MFMAAKTLSLFIKMCPYKRDELKINIPHGDPTVDGAN